MQLYACLQGCHSEIFSLVNCKFHFIFYSAQVAEYSEISEEVQQRRNPDGKLTFREGNLANHFFTISFLEKIVK